MHNQNAIKYSLLQMAPSSKCIILTHAIPCVLFWQIQSPTRISPNVLTLYIYIYTSFCLVSTHQTQKATNFSNCLYIYEKLHESTPHDMTSDMSHSLRDTTIATTKFRIVILLPMMVCIYIVDPALWRYCWQNHICE